MDERNNNINRLISETFMKVFVNLHGFRQGDLVVFLADCD